MYTCTSKAEKARKEKKYQNIHQADMHREQAGVLQMVIKCH